MAAKKSKSPARVKRPVAQKKPKPTKAKKATWKTEADYERAARKAVRTIRREDRKEKPKKLPVVVRNPKIDEEKAIRAAMVAQANADKAWRDEMAGWVNELKHIQTLVHRASHQNSPTTCRNEVCLLINRRLKSRAFRAIERAAATKKTPGPKPKPKGRAKPKPARSGSKTRRRTVRTDEPRRAAQVEAPPATDAAVVVQETTEVAA